MRLNLLVVGMVVLGLTGAGRVGEARGPVVARPAPAKPAAVQPARVAVSVPQDVNVLDSGGEDLGPLNQFVFTRTVDPNDPNSAQINITDVQKNITTVHKVQSDLKFMVVSGAVAVKDGKLIVLEPGKNSVSYNFITPDPGFYPTPDPGFMPTPAGSVSKTSTVDPGHMPAGTVDPGHMPAGQINTVDPGH